MTYQKVVKKAQSLFTNNDMKHACLWLFIELLAIEPSQYYLNLNKEVPTDILNTYNELILKYLNEKIPVQYLIGHSYFYGRKFFVNEATLIPRSETDLLVDKTLKLIEKKFCNKIDILDLATGSGCIGITLKLELDAMANVTVSDISKDALAVASKNAKYHQAEIKVIQSNWFEDINGKYDLVIANPPYIPESYDVDEIVNKEPHDALYSGSLGIDSYEAILKDVNQYLKKDGMIAFEHGYDQKQLIKDLANKYLNNIEIVQEIDLSGLDRYTFIFKKGD